MSPKDVAEINSNGDIMFKMTPILIFLIGGIFSSGGAWVNIGHLNTTVVEHSIDIRKNRESSIRMEEKLDSISGKIDRVYKEMAK